MFPAQPQLIVLDDDGADGAADGGGGGGAHSVDDEEQWSCPTCTFLNHAVLRECEMCSSPRPDAAAGANGGGADGGGAAVVASAVAAAPVVDLSAAPDMAEVERRFSPSPALHELCNETTGVYSRALLLGAFRLLAKQRLADERVDEHLLERLPREDVAEALHRAQRASELLHTVAGLAAEEAAELGDQPCCVCKRSGAAVMLLETNPSCKHQICSGCLRSLVLEAMDAQACAGLKCPGRGRQCVHELPQRVVQIVLEAGEFERFLSVCMASFLESEETMVTCPNAECGAVMEIVQPSHVVIPAEMTERDDRNNLLSPEAFEHWTRYRVRCRSCQADFCAECKLAPYHKGYTCAGLAQYDAARHCRFCETQLRTGANSNAAVGCALPDVCVDCKELADHCCLATLPCGHRCNGIREETPGIHPERGVPIEHTPCLQEACAREAGLHADGDEFCNICFVEGLSAAPCVQLECGHIFHAHCVRAKIESRWPGTRITFGFLDCPLCKQPMRHWSVERMLAPLLELRASLEDKALARLKVEQMEEDDKLTDPTSRFFGKKLEYAMASFAYYTCFKCGKPYFGGRRDCEQNANANNRPVEEFVCFDCCDLQHTTCDKPEHREYHVWKCRFCCSVAVWFCWGTTHFCHHCHSHQPWERAKWPIEKFTQCKDRESCALKVDHPPNSSAAESEFSLGCGLCADEIRRLEEEQRADDPEFQKKKAEMAKKGSKKKKKSFLESLFG